VRLAALLQSITPSLRLSPHSGYELLKIHRTGKTLDRAAILSMILFVAFWVSPSQVEASPANTKLPAMERHLFFRSYNDDSMEARLERIERRIFGTARSGTVEERLQRLNFVLAEKIEASKADPVETVMARIKSGELTVSDNTTAKTTTSGTIKQDSPQSQKDKTPIQAQPIQKEKRLSQEEEELAVRAAREAELRNLLAEAVSFWRSGNSQEAIKSFKQVVRLDPQNSEAYFSLGIIAESGGKLDDALIYYRRAAQARADNAEYHEAVTAVTNKINTRATVASRRDEVRSLAQDALAAFRRGELVSALDLYKRLDAKAPGEPLVQYNIGTIYLAMRQPEEALKYYRKARRLDPRERRYISACEKLEEKLYEREKQRREAEYISRQRKSAQAQPYTYQGQSSPFQGPGGMNASAGPLLAQPTTFSPPPL